MVLCALESKSHLPKMDSEMDSSWPEVDVIEKPSTGTTMRLMAATILFRLWLEDDKVNGKKNCPT